MASKSAAASGEKKKSSSSKKNKEKPSSRNSAAKDKEKTRSSKKSSKKSSSPSAEAATATATTATKTEETVSTAPVQIPHDPDAIQLFRRYDRARAGALTRLDFLQLLKDYANPPTNAHANPDDSNSDPHARLSTMPSAAHRRPRKPLSLTETSGIPLGFERSDKNSEFEAGQLFERYDKDRAGALTLDKFHTFFADFKPQLTAFVDDFNYFLPPSATPPAFVAQTPTPEATLVSSPPLSTHGATPELDPKSKSDTKRQLKSEYQTALWKLRKLYKEELLGQRERLLESMTSIRDVIAKQQRSSSNHSDTKLSSRWPLRGNSEDPRDPRSRRWMNHDDGGNQAVELYETMEEDLERIDELGGYLRRYVEKGGDASSGEMKEFLAHANDLHEQAQYLAMKDYALPRNLIGNTSKNEIHTRQQHAADPPSPTSSSRSKRPSGHQTSRSVDANQPPHSSNNDTKNSAEQEHLLRVKDQMIYQLLRERTELRKQMASMESYLQELSEVSTQEMKKWARLTDEMQAEIEHLRTQVHLKAAKRG